MSPRPALVGLAFVAHLSGQVCMTSRNMSAWVNCEVTQLVRQRIADSDHTKQAEEPAIASNSTTLADRSSAPDVAGVSVNLGQLASKSRTPDTSDIGLTVSLYGLYSAFRQTSPFDQTLFDKAADWRRFSFSLDESFPEDSTSTASMGSYSTQAKVLLSHSRDVPDPSNKNAVNDMAQQIGDIAKNGGVGAAQAFAKVSGDILLYLYAHRSEANKSMQFIPDFSAFSETPDGFASILSDMNGEDLRHIQGIILNQIVPLVAAQKTIQNTIDKITHMRQYSVDFSSRDSKGTGSNLYRSEFIVDTPLNELNKGLTATSNISWDFQNAQTAKTVNRQIARAVQQFQYSLGSGDPLPPKNPFTITVSGEGDWGTNGTPTYKAQFKLGIPVVSGLTLPLSFLYASQTATSTHADAKVQLGIVIDTSKLAHAFKSP